MHRYQKERTVTHSSLNMKKDIEDQCVIAFTISNAGEMFIELNREMLYRHFGKVFFHTKRIHFYFDIINHVRVG